VILIEAKAEIIVFGRVGLGREKIPDFRFASMEFFKKGSEPTWELAAFCGEGCEPHLPVESGLERGDLGWETIRRAGLVFEYDGLPLNSVGTPLEGEFGAASGHNGEESVAGVKMPWGESSLPLGEKG
jgi:hypothetical protein